MENSVKPIALSENSDILFIMDFCIDLKKYCISRI